ncbi:MAG: hypothetical protein QNJ54_31710 [Prochloraceae cyanobacterium]|nr:hypothetical protein [Prochloraceae cyanobacterium]
MLPIQILGNLASTTVAAVGQITNASEILNQTFELGKNTYESWNKVWDYTIFAPRLNYLWDNLVSLGLKLAFLSIIYLVLTEGMDFIRQQDYSALISMFVWPVVIAFFLGHNGYLLASTLKIVRNFAVHETHQIYQIKIGDFNLKDSLIVYQITSNELDAIDAAIKPCQGQSGEELKTCVNGAMEEIRALHGDNEEAAYAFGIRGGLKGLRDFLGGVIGFNPKLPGPAGAIMQIPGVKTIIAHGFRSGYAKILKAIGWCLQWAFVNTLEISLLLSALVSPLALGLSLLPIQGRAIIGWIIGYISLWGISLGYSIITGLMAWVMVNSGLEAIADLAFIFYLAVFAPSLATTIMTLNGMAIHQGVVNNMNEIKDAISSGISFVSGAISKLAMV